MHFLSLSLLHLGLNCQPLTTGHMQRNDTLKLMAAIKYQAGANSYQVGWWSFNVTLFDDLDNPRFNPSSKDGQRGVLEVRGGGVQKEQQCSSPANIYLYYCFLWASDFSQKNGFAFCLPVVSTSYRCWFTFHSGSHSEWLSSRQQYEARQEDWVQVCVLRRFSQEALCVLFRRKPEKPQESPHGVRWSLPWGKQSLHPAGTHWTLGSSLSALNFQFSDRLPSPTFLWRQF